MFSASAEFYDLLYSTIKDYQAEAAQVAGLLREVNPGCRTVLDVACGTGEHARLLAADGFDVDGLDLDPRFVGIARQKHPAGRFFEADMTDFHLPCRYDAITCLFSSIGYVRTLDRVARTLSCFAGHLGARGVVLVEPWFEPGVLDEQRVALNTGEKSGLRVTRVSRVEVHGRLSRLHFDYEITEPSGTRRETEIHELGLFTTREMLQAFQAAGLEADYRPTGLTGRGLFVARSRMSVVTERRV